jgi:hypothetical protein
VEPLLVTTPGAGELILICSPNSLRRLSRLRSRSWNQLVAQSWSSYSSRNKRPRLPGGLLKGTPSSVVVIETDNYFPRQRDGYIDEIEAGTTESRWVEKQLGRPVVKSFNNTVRSPGRIALPIASEHSKDVKPAEAAARLRHAHKNLSLAAGAFGFR